jgi:hypothetical protein
MFRSQANEGKTIMNNAQDHCLMALLVVLASWLAGPWVHADVVTDWTSTAGEIAVAGKLPPGGDYRAMAVVQTAVYEAINTITKRYPPARVSLQAAPGASVDAAVAAANRATLSALAPSQQATIDKAYQAAMATLPDGPAKTAGIAVGEQAAAAILAVCAGDGFDAPESYRPHTTPGVYVPTVLPIITHWPGRKPWLLASADQFRPGPPPSLTSAVWARDYNEIKALGAKQSTQRSGEQTAMARFWEARVPTIYLPVVLSVATAPGREPTQNARLLAVATQAMDDALIAVADAKYHYNFWRPITAIRNGDLDGNDATEREASWVPFVDTPMHPEYPCAHCILSAAVATVLHAEVGGGTMPTLRTTSPTAPGMERSWTTIEAFMQEVAQARIYDGVHYRTSTEVGTTMGQKIGELAGTKSLRPLK